MELFDIRILRTEQSPSLITQASYASGHFAVRAAERMAQGKRFEVWRGMECIYSTMAAGSNMAGRKVPPELAHRT